MNSEALEFWKRALQALQTAEELVDRDPDASSSRAYYAAFFAASALLALEGQEFVKHTAIERAVHRDLVKTGRWAFSWLASLRYTADYGGTDHVQPAEAKEAVDRAKSILQAVQDSTPEAFPEPEA